MNKNVWTELNKVMKILILYFFVTSHTDLECNTNHTKSRIIQRRYGLTLPSNGHSMSTFTPSIMELPWNGVTISPSFWVTPQVVTKQVGSWSMKRPVKYTLLHPQWLFMTSPNFDMVFFHDISFTWTVNTLSVTLSSG